MRSSPDYPVFVAITLLLRLGYEQLWRLVGEWQTRARYHSPAYVVEQLERLWRL